MLRLLFILLVTANAAVISASLNAKEKNAGKFDTVVKGLNSPWAMAFLPNGDILVTERKGTLRVVRNGKKLAKPIAGVPPVYHAGQGGLLDVVLDKDFIDNKKLYLSYAHGSRRANATRLLSATFDGDSLSDQRVIFTASPSKDTPQHYSGRIAQLPDGTLLLTVGDGFDYREQSQNLASHLGKIIRVDQLGAAPADNPFINNPKAKPEIWSTGHRNQQGLVVVNGVVYQNEHGPRGGDEVNIIKPGLNYGWPVITYGIDYNGARISPFTEYQGLEQPAINWTPSIAPSSMAYHDGDLYVTSLAERSVRKLSIDGDTITDQGIVFPELRSRLRQIVSAPDGTLYILTDGKNAKILKLNTQ